MEGECLTLYRAVKHDSEKFKGIVKIITLAEQTNVMIAQCLNKEM